MNNRCIIASSLLAIIMTTSSYAETLKCPTIEQVRAASFSYGMKWGKEWLVYSDPIIDDNDTEWTVAADFENGEVTNTRAALNYANDTIKTIGMVYPEPTQDRDSHVCKYANSFPLFDLVAIDSVFPYRNLLHKN